MTDKRNQTIDEYLDEQIENRKKGTNNKNTRKYKLVGGICAGVAIITTITLASCSKKKSKNVSPDLSTSVSSSISTVDLNSLGNQIEFPSEDKLDQPKYGDVVSGNINKNELVEGIDPKTNKKVIYKNQEAKDKAANIGKKTDTKGGTLTVDNNGKVKEKTESYEVKDTNGNVVASGEGKTPDGTVYDSGVNAYVAPSDAGKYVLVDVNYYDPYTGDLVLSKGDTVEKETLERAKRTLTTNSNVTTNNMYESSNQSYNNQNTYITNSVELFTADTNYYDINTGALVIAKGETVTLNTFRELSSTLTTNPNVVYHDSSNLNANSNGVINRDGSYTIFGMTFDSKADYEQWVLQGYTGYSDMNGRMKSDFEVERELQKVR